MNIIIIGPQGAGKTKQATLISKKLGIAFIDVGNIFRELAKENTEIGKQIKQVITQGVLADDEITFRIVHQRLQRQDTLQGFIIDDFPKTLAQAKMLDQAVDIHAVIHLQLDDKQCMGRLLKRKRHDDTKEKIKKRLAIYREITEPLTEYYKPRHIVHDIDAQPSIESVFNNIMIVLDSVSKTQ
jgi:adenylate kinase